MTTKKLEWKGNILYCVFENENGLRTSRRVGEIKPSGLQDGWMVFVRSRLKHFMDNREHAVEQLERYA